MLMRPTGPAVCGNSIGRARSVADCLLRLVLGRAPSGATQADLGLLQAAAGALLAGGDSKPRSEYATKLNLA
jgi:hypothetical protein